MREIKFRGKRLDDGEWVCGHLADVIIGVDKFEDRAIINLFGTALAIACDPATVGQFTGLKDRDGKEIYEGDILLTQGQVHKFIQVVEFHNTYETCGRGWIGVNHKTVDNFGHSNPVQGGFSFYQMPCSCQVIGNIHDNPELLKTE